jgi:hypothetical protein
MAQNDTTGEFNTLSFTLNTQFMAGAYYMNIQDRRQNPRSDSLNLLHYACLDDNDHPWHQGMGRTLNVSMTGLKMETHEPIESEWIVLFGLGLGNDLVDIKCKTIYSNEITPGKFETGIEFLEMEPIAAKILKQFIKAFDNA